MLVAAIAASAVADRLFVHRMRLRHERRVAETVQAARAVVEDARESLQREARMLADDPAVIQGTRKGDWATLARGASPRMVALTVAHLADLLLVVDAAGTPLVQVPATPRIVTTSLVPPFGTAAAVQRLNGRPYMLGVAPIGGRAERIGVVAVGRDIDNLERRVGSLPGRPLLIAVVDGAAVSAARHGLSVNGWQSAAPRSLVLDGESWNPSPLADGMWLLVRTAEYDADVAWARRGLLGGLTLAVLALLAAVLGVGGRPARALVSRRRDDGPLRGTYATRAARGSARDQQEDRRGGVAGGAAAVHRGGGGPAARGGQRRLSPRRGR
jgi:hypothetical protein